MATISKRKAALRFQQRQVMTSLKAKHKNDREYLRKTRKASLAKEVETMKTSQKKLG